MQNVGTDAIDGSGQRATKASRHGRVDQAELHRHAFDPRWIIRFRVAVNQGVGINTLLALFLQQVGKKHLHATAVGRIELADM